MLSLATIFYVYVNALNSHYNLTKIIVRYAIHNSSYRLYTTFEINLLSIIVQKPSIDHS